MKKIMILVAYHKPGLIIKNDVYQPIQVGKDTSDFDLGICGDNSGDNMSLKNPIYCEMTALYWGWKNLKNVDYVGLCHYRRYFTFVSKPLLQIIKERIHFYANRLFGNLKRPGNNRHFINQRVLCDGVEFKKEALIFSSQLKSVIEKNDYDFIVPTPYEMSCRNVEQHFIQIGRDHIYLLKKIVKEMNPVFYSYLEIALSSNKLYAANMFIAKAAIFNDYCSLVFPVLEDHLHQVIKSNWCDDPLKEKCYSRISGYLAELLTSAYVYKLTAERYNILYVNSMFLDNN